MRFAVLRVLVLVIALGLLAVGAWAAKPGGGGGGPVPPGTILFEYGGTPMTMKADGSGKQLADPANETTWVPSHGTYGASARRWWLVRTDDYLLWATNDGVDWMQVTNLLETDNGDGTKTVMRLVGKPAWSNDGVDSFCSVSAIHWVQLQSDPVPATVRWDYFRCIICLNVSALELQTRQDASLGDPLLTLEDAEFIVTTPLGYSENLAEHDWSPDGTQVAYRFRDESQGTSQVDLFVADVGPSSILPVDALDGVKIFDSTHSFIYGPRWAPPTAADPSQIAFVSNGLLHTVRSNGTDLVAVYNTGANTAAPAWSPNGQHLAFRQITVRAYTNWYQICRIPAAGGSVTVMTGDMDKTVHKTLTAWR